ncbi:hypothetical protein [Thermasporomyces composti]|uniref:PH (Pleckstrin Homology) domain-containing protein n=1 Tax=Thermasporomyces composti TaxID=696763 RepID=A0A3D9VA62_THECX|nr:hypothetical protein [Thermasporomyces composti]REF37050.1 hypothetical protein DFJ64_2486 [Thermasporomyces composti]
MDQPIRTTFGPGPRRRSAIWRGLLLTLGLFVVGVVLWNVGNVGAGAILIILSLLLGGVMAYGLMTWLRPVTLRIGENGLDVSVSGHRFAIPWTDVKSWGIGEWGMGRFTDSASPSLIVWPHDHVPDAGQGADQSLWIPSGRCWRLCRLHYLDGTIEDVEAAMNHFAAGKRRAVGA